MGIYIKGMKMPHTCMECDLCYAQCTTAEQVEALQMAVFLAWTWR